jgi:hypothetical protein
MLTKITHNLLNTIHRFNIPKQNTVFWLGSEKFIYAYFSINFRNKNFKHVLSPAIFVLYKMG